MQIFRNRIGLVCLGFCSVLVASSCNLTSSPVQNPVAKYYVINLDRSYSRYAFVFEQFYRAGVSVTRFPAVDSKNLDLSQLPLEVLMPNEPLNMARRTSPTLTPSEIACYLSHYEVLKLANEAMIREEDFNFLAGPKQQVAAIFEDDTSFSPNIDNEIASVVRELPEGWDILYLGCNANSFPECVTEKQSDFGSLPFVTLDSQCIAGAYAYVVSKEGTRKLLNRLMPIRMPIDEWIVQNTGPAESDLHAYCANPELVLTGDFATDVVGR